MAFVQGPSIHSQKNKNQKSIIILKKLCGLMVFLPNHSTFYAFPLPIQIVIAWLRCEYDHICEEILILFVNKSTLCY